MVKSALIFLIGGANDYQLSMVGSNPPSAHAVDRKNATEGGTSASRLAPLSVGHILVGL